MSARRRLYLMRHGEVAYFAGRSPDSEQEGVALTARGREQALAAGRVLAGVRFDRVVTSGLRRTVETAQLVLGSSRSGAAPVVVEEDDELEELRGIRFEDVAEDRVDDEFLAVFHGVAELDARYLGGERIGDLVERVGRRVDALLADPGWNTALLVLHGGVNRAILSRALTGEPSFLGHLEQTPGCLNVLDHGPTWFVRAVNVTPPDLAHETTRLTTVELMAAGYRDFRGFAAVD